MCFERARLALACLTVSGCGALALPNQDGGALGDGGFVSRDGGVQIFTSNVTWAGDEGTLPTPGRIDPQLEAELMAVMRGQWVPNEILKAVILDSDWFSSGSANPPSQLIRAAIVERANGRCHVFQVSFERVLVGTAYGSVHYFGVGMSSSIDCAVVR